MAKKKKLARVSKKKVKTISGEFDIERRERLRRDYLQAKEKKEEQFTFEDYTFVTQYAKYMLEFLDGQLDKITKAQREALLAASEEEGTPLPEEEKADPIGANEY